jgi:RNA polymerase sigma factor (sigma-70 family)
MTEVPTTRASLIVRIRDLRDSEACEEFVETYGPVVYGYGRRQGLQGADAADLTQEVLRAVAGAIGEFRYDPRRGSFRSWLFTVARTKRLNLMSRRVRHPGTLGNLEMVQRLNKLSAANDADLEAAEWDRAFDQCLLDRAAVQARTEVNEATWLAFQRTAIEGTNPRTVAQKLGMSVGAIYTARCRVLARLRDVGRQMQCDEVPA